MKKLFNNVYFIFTLRLFLGLFLLYTSHLKIINPSEFAQAIRAYNIIPDSLSTIPAIFLPWLELFCGIFLISGLFLQSSLYVSMGLMVLFTINILIAILRGLDIDCGCGASISGLEKVSWAKIIENSVIIYALFLISIQQKYIFALDNKFELRH